MACLMYFLWTHGPLKFLTVNADGSNGQKLEPRTCQIIKCRVVDPDPDWIRIQRLCGSGSVLEIRIQGQEN
jgi:hypothetical protein